MILDDSQVQMILRLLMSCFLGGLVGLERQSGDRPAGFRTHTLVCMGSCLFMLVSIYGFDGVGTVRDPARLAAQVVSGVGFLGAGTILHSGVNVKGLTTAASIWMIAAIGLTCGVGLYGLATFSTFLMLATLMVFQRWSRKLLPLGKDSEHYTIIINANDEPGNIEEILALLNVDGMKVKGVNVISDFDKSTVNIKINILVAMQKTAIFKQTILKIKQLEFVNHIKDIGQFNQ